MKLTKSTFFLGCLVGGLGAGALPMLVQFFQSPAQAETKLLPFQGRLTDAAGNAVADGAKVVEFKMYDAPTGGNVTWAGEVHKLSVNGGLVNTMLGSKAGLGSVDFASASFLQITVDANGDGAITAADPPLLPRQSVVSAVYANEAGNARRLNEHPAAQYEAIFDGNDPASGFINGVKLKAATVSGTALAGDAVTSAKVLNNSLTNDDIGTGAVSTDEIVNGSIQPEDLSASLLNGVTPVGAISAYIRDTPPPGWLLCDGHEEPVAAYQALAAAIETKFGQSSMPGTGEGAKFKLPDLRGMFLRGINSMGQSGSRTDAFADPYATVSSNAGMDGKRFNPFVGGSPVGIGSYQYDWVGLHQHSSGDLTALIHVSNDNNVHANHRTLPAGMTSWNAERGGNAAAIAADQNVTRGTHVAGSTGEIPTNVPYIAPTAEIPLPSPSDTRPQNFSVNYIIKY